MKNRIVIPIVLRERFVRVDVAPLSPDRSVGIMEWSFEDEIITDVFGQVLSWELTEEEIQLVNDNIHNGRIDNDNR